MDCETTQAKGLKSALAIAARTASTRYQETLPPDALAHMLRTGEAPEKYHPHLMVLLDETPLPIVVSAIKEASGSVPAKKILRHLSKWANEWKMDWQVWA